ncbi:bifunctional ADP-dependent NAD(P)H-hydrate dehydratase/NAD(P)H-hydrate epimerase [Oceaniserpentilla sp. 4NH20-0058]|uniref:NAD(P)H-hydrate dehydratase n=1 Tax=Oceaniserpentilla sp. 4NH20-0058 TaxID=3127660 RepID=UPI003106BB90
MKPLTLFPTGQPLYTPNQCQALDRTCIDDLGFDGYELMQQAAQAAFGVLISEWPNAHSLIILCGKGNNGGDGFEMASLACEHGLGVQLVFDGKVDELTGEAKQAAFHALDNGLTVIASDQVNWALSNCVIVDALLGTGIQGPPREPMASLIQQANTSGLPILAVDIPSGLNGLTGCVVGEAINAHITVTMLLNKQGLYTGDGPNYVGQVRVAGLAVPKQIVKTISSSCELQNWQHLKHAAIFEPRIATSHKGHFGHVLLVGGDTGMAGAISLAASAALRSGAGLVSVATRPENVSIVVTRQPEIMAHGVNSVSDIKGLIEKASVIAIGPGLGQGSWGQQMLQAVMASEKPVVMDADALNLLASQKIHYNLSSRISVLTPHPGEAARLLNTSTAQIGQDRFKALQEIAKLYSSEVVLKGAGTLVGSSVQTSICQDGNPGMASGGMGDVLTGVLIGIMAQNEAILPSDLHSVVTSAVCLHSAAADEAAKAGQTSLVASDLLNTIRQLLN